MFGWAPWPEKCKDEAQARGDLYSLPESPLACESGLYVVPKRPLVIVVLVVVVTVVGGCQPADVEPANDSTGDTGRPTSQITTERSAKLNANMHREMDPRNDGWESETLSEQTGAILRQLARMLSQRKRIDTASLATVLADDFKCSAIRPESLDEAFRDSNMVVRRGPRTANDREGNAFRAASGLAEAMWLASEPLRSVGNVRVQVKIVSLDHSADSVSTTALVDAAGSSSKDAVQTKATWRCHWNRAGDALRLASIRSENYEEVKARVAGGKWFVDCTGSVLADNTSYHDQLAFGLSHWTAHLPKIHGTDLFTRYGLAMGDVNGDSLEDLYICQPGGLPNRLLIQRRDGTVSDVSESAGVDWLDFTSSALFVDLDNDGDQDLMVGTPFHLLVMANDGNGQFSLQADLPIRFDVHSLSAADYDGDADLDIYVTIAHAYDGVEPEKVEGPFIFHDANNGAPNKLFRNDISSGAWKFTDVTDQMGLDVDNDRHSLAASWEDYDNDGDPDLYVANDYGRNCLYRNDGHRFVNVAAEVDVVDYGAGMSVSWGDCNRDGWMDLYVGNMFSSAGNRITDQPAFKPDAKDNVRSLYRRFVKGNSLFVNRGGKFEDVSGPAGVDRARWAWASLFVDLNNDGWEDLLVANGFITNQSTDDL